MIPIETYSICDECKEIIPAKIFEKDGSLFIAKECPTHGTSEKLFYENKTFYETITETRSKVPYCTELKCLSCDQHVQRAKSILIDLTERCNLNCPVCCSDSGRDNLPDDIPLAIILKKLSRFAHVKDKPSIFLFGGEPTLRDDLFEIILELKKRGFLLKLATNGIKLADEDYVRRLKSSGLDWVYLQFDGFSDEIYAQLRGRRLLALKLRVIELLKRYELKVCLGCCIVKGINDQEIGQILNFGLQRRNILHIGFLPVAVQGRNQLLSEKHRTDALFVMQEIEKQSRGAITVSDFIASRRIGNLFFKLFKRPMFQQTNCFFLALVMNFGKKWFLINRFLKPRYLLGNLGVAVLVLLGYKKILKFNKISSSENLTLISIEEFRDGDSVDFVDASRCNKVYLTRRGFVPPCIYNIVFRGKEPKAKK